MALLVPVLNRPHRIAPLFQNVAEVTPEQHRVLFCASDEASINELRRLGAEFIYDEGGTWPERINNLFFLTSEPYVFLGADDLLFHSGWLTAAMRAMRDVEGVVVVNDLHNPNGTSALVSRRYIEECGTIDTPGLVVHPGYGHNYVDNECWETAQKRGRFAYCPESVVEHLHPCAGKSEDDETYQKGLSTLVEDQALYESRRHLWA